MLALLKRLLFLDEHVLGLRLNIQIKNRNNDYFEMLFDLEVKSSNHVDEIINALKVKQVVQYIDRDKSDR